MLVNGSGAELTRSLPPPTARTSLPRAPDGVNPHSGPSSRFLLPPAACRARTWEKGRNSKAAEVAGWNDASADVAWSQLLEEFWI